MFSSSTRSPAQRQNKGRRSRTGGYGVPASPRILALPAGAAAGRIAAAPPGRTGRCCGVRVSGQPGAHQAIPTAASPTAASPCAASTTSGRIRRRASSQYRPAVASTATYRLLRARRQGRRPAIRGRPRARRTALGPVVRPFSRPSGRLPQTICSGRWSSSRMITRSGLGRSTQLKPSSSNTCSRPKKGIA
jgi:hypothetical protein